MAESPDAATAPREVVLAEPWLHLDSVHGEGVVWHAARQRLLFVDLPVGRIWSVDVQDGSATPLDVPGTVGAVHPTVDPDVLVIADSDGIALYRDGAVERLAAPLGDRPDARMNDANVDPAGRYFAGSMAYDQRPGGADLYRLDLDGTLTTAVPAATISNGLDWSPDERLCYFVDSPLRRVDVFDYDRASGEISHRRTFVDTADVPGIPDGLTVDAAGGVWVAFFGGGRICRYTPDGSLDVVVRLPVSQVTSACFGGSDLDELYISTSTEDLSPEQVADQSAAGAVFRVRTGHVGKPGALFAGVR